MRGCGPALALIERRTLCLEQWVASNEWHEGGIEWPAEAVRELEHPFRVKRLYSSQTQDCTSTALRSEVCPGLP